jgi:hypothetical protein
MKIIKDWNNFILEYVNFNKVKEISIGISENIDYEKMFVLRNVFSPEVFEVSGSRLNKIDSKIFKQDNLIKNYSNYFKFADIKYSEIIKIEFQGYNWVAIFLCYTKNEKYSVVTYSPDMNDFDIIKVLNDYLESKNFETIKKKSMNIGKNISSNFINNLIKIFRNISGRNYSSSMLSDIKEEFDIFKKDNSSEWDKYEKWKMRSLGSSVKCVRFMDLSPNFEFQMVNGGVKKLKDLTVKDLFYYPISGREFSQWAECDSNISNIKNDLKGIYYSGIFGVKSYIPTKKIIMSNKIMMYNFSPNVYEREVIVEHDVRDNVDKMIICKIV